MLLHILMPATLVFFAGVADDFLGLSPIWKIVVEVGSGYWLFHLGCRVALSDVVFRGTDYSTALSCALTIAWVVMLSNAFNLIDGLDGLAAGASIFPLLTFSAVALFHHNGQLAVASVILIGALLGFLRFNFNPATIFLGDSGSLFLGFMLSALSLAASQAKASTLLSLALPMVACGLPIAETLVSIVRRFLSGRPIFSADREHFHHRLLKLGFTHRQVVVLLFGVSGACSLMSVLLLFPKVEALILVGIVLGLLTLLGVSRLGYPEFDELGRVLLRVIEQKVVIAQNVKVRHIAGRIARATHWDDAVGVLRAGFQGSEFSALDLRIYQQDHGRDNTRVYARTILLSHFDGQGKWTITLQFMGGDYIGYLELHCPYKEQSLMIDVNVLLQVLQPAFCVVCSRLSSKHRLPSLAVGEQVLAQRAGGVGK